MIKELNLFDFEKYKENLISIYIETFSAPPRNELINRFDVEIYFKKMFTCGKIFVSLNDFNKINGFIVIIPAIYTEFQTEGMYISCLVSIEKRKGIAQSLMKLMEVKYFNQNLLIRCRTDIIEINNLLHKLDYQIIYEVENIINKVKSKKYIWLKKNV